MPEGSEFVRIRGAGGDGGVECFWCKPDRTKSGWQAKYISDFDRALVALSASLLTALQVHPTLDHYVVCLAYDLTGETNRPGKSQLEKFGEWKDAEIAKALAAGRILNVELKTPSDLLDRLTQIDPSNGKLRFWFDATILGPNWFVEHLADVRAAARPRYTPELRIDTPTSLAFDALCDTPRWKAGVLDRLKKVKQALNDWERGLGETGKVWGVPFPESVMPQGTEAKIPLESLLDSFEKLNRGEATVSDLPIAGQVDATDSAFRKISEDLRTALESEHGEGVAENASWKQFMAEYQVTFPAQHYDKAKEIIKLCEGLHGWIGGEVVSVNGRGAMLLTGQAGVGKTHAICDAADRRLDLGLLTVVCFAEALPGDGEVADNIRAKLGLPADIGRDELLSILSSAGEMSGGPLLLALDGLNETQPRSYWIHQLPSLVTQVSRLPFLRLCVSCRTTYVDHVVPATLDIPRVNHLGFAGMEFEACREFCEHYGLEHPATPFLAEEFSNGLFLRLVCEATRDEGLRRIPSGSYGTRSAINTFLRSKDRRYSQQFAVDIRRRYPSKAVSALADEITKHDTRSLNFDAARTVIERACDGAQGNLLEWLIEEGLIRVDAVMGAEQSEDHAFLPFERLGDHLLAERHLTGESAESIQSAFEQGGKLEFLLNEERWEDLAGLREAIALQIPEAFGVELPDLAPDRATRLHFDWLTLRALTWRDASSITSDTSEVILRTVRTASLLEATFEQQLLMSLLPSAVDAYWLDSLLKDDQLVNRDWYWCKYLHLSFERGKAVKRLIDTAFKVEARLLPADSVERWMVVLGWFCAAADRRVRAGASKAMVRLLTDHPKLWKVVISNFWSVDDDYIVERALVVTYGAMLRNPDPGGVRAAAEYVIENLFVDTAKHQNALIRDHARCIVELALHIGAIDNIDTRIIEPPYESEWPLTIPTEEEIGELKASIEELPALHRSCFSDDFFTYTLSRFRRFEEQLSRKDMAGWIFREVFNMGYDLKSTKEYDGVMGYQYGGGRGRPKWAERIGKKYQWIALARLAARLGDHVTPKEDDWEEGSLVVPLVYESGRDTDPSILSQNDLRQKVQCWWSSYIYPHASYKDMSDDDWVAFEGDTPDLAQLVHAVDGDGKEWIHLAHYPEWNTRHDSEEVGILREYRLFWLQIRSFIVDRAEGESILVWAEGANWFNRWMPEGRDYYQGFVGEYPWGIPFQLEGYDRSDVVRPDTKAVCPAELVPAVHDIAAEHEFDSYQESTVRVSVPAQPFFDQDLSWSPEGGYTRDGATVFLDPTLRSPGPSATMAELSGLERWLESHNKSIFFTILGEKLAMTDNAKPRMVISAGAIFDGKNWRWTQVSKIMH